MSRTIKQKYDFPTQMCLEVLFNDDWCRVTCDTFRAFYGPRRVQGELFKGKVYYKGTNYVYTGKARSFRVIEITELNIDLKKRHREQVAIVSSAMRNNHKFL